MTKCKACDKLQPDEQPSLIVDAPILNGCKYNVMKIWEWKEKQKAFHCKHNVMRAWEWKEKRKGNCLKCNVMKIKEW